jgi:hypothetical protein
MIRSRHQQPSPRPSELLDEREKLRARAAVLQAKAEWEQQKRREDLLLPAGFQLERARALLADPGDLTITDIEELIALSSAREEAERKEKEKALDAMAAAQAERQKALDEAEQALIRAADAQRKRARVRNTAFVSGRQQRFDLRMTRTYLKSPE